MFLGSMGMDFLFNPEFGMAHTVWDNRISIGKLTLKTVIFKPIYRSTKIDGIEKWFDFDHRKIPRFQNVNRLK